MLQLPTLPAQGSQPSTELPLPGSLVGGVSTPTVVPGLRAEKRSLYSSQDLALQPPPPLSNGHSVRGLCAPHLCKPLPLSPLCLPKSSPILAAPLSSHPHAMAMDPEDFFDEV